MITSGQNGGPWWFLILTTLNFFSEPTLVNASPDLVAVQSLLRCVRVDYGTILSIGIGEELRLLTGKVKNGEKFLADFKIVYP